MIFDNAIEQVLAEKSKQEVAIVKLGTVTSVSGGRAKVQHYGEDTSSGKTYTFIDGYFPEVGDKVAMLPQANTYIIIGKVMDTAPVEKYATITYVDDTFLVKAYKNKLEDNNETITLTNGNALLPSTDNHDDLGSSSKYFKNLYIKKLILDGSEYTEFKQDRIEVKSGNTTYSLIATVSNGYVTLTPSSNDKWKLGTKSYQLNEAWLGLFRGEWKSGKTTERSVSWNNSNALVPDTNNSVDLGSSSYGFKQIFADALVGVKSQYQSGSNNNVAWSSASDILPNNTNVVNLGSSSKQFNKIYGKELYINGTLIDISGITLDKLTTKYGNTNYTLTLSVQQGGSSYQYERLEPSVNKKFDLGSSSYLFRNLYLETLLADYWSNGTRKIQFNSSHNIVPDVTNAVSLGTSSLQYLNVYGKNLYVNGTAVSSDRRLKEDIKALEEKHLAFFKALRPVQYRFIDGDSGRMHTGFIAQEVEDAVKEAGMTDKDMAVVVKDREDNYYIRYEEIIAVQTKVIQDLMAKVDNLESRLARLERYMDERR